MNDVHCTGYLHSSFKILLFLFLKEWHDHSLVYEKKNNPELFFMTFQFSYSYIKGLNQIKYQRYSPIFNEDVRTELIQSQK